MVRRRVLVLAAVCLSYSVNTAPAAIVDFEDLPLAPNSYYNGVGVQGDTDFESGGATFNNYVDPTYSTWGGWSYADMSLPPSAASLAEPDYTYQYNAAAASGSRGSSNYAMGYWDSYTPTVPTITLPAGEHPVSLQVTNSTYTVLSMLHDDGYSKVFAGPSGGTPGDWFKLTITGYSDSGQQVGAVDFYLADFRSSDPAQQYIVQDWTNVNLLSLYDAHTLTFTMTSTDNNSIGILTPAYVAVDDLSLTKVAGDLNGDGIVNAQDIAVVASDWLNRGPLGDANGDGIVNVQDIATIASNWLSVSSPASAPSQADAMRVAVPEPGAALLAAIGLALLATGVKLRR